MTDTQPQAVPELLIRAMVPDDLAFVLATWLKGCHHGSTIGRRIPSRVFYREHHKVVMRILNRPETSVLVASLTDAPDVVIGYLVHENDDLLHWCHVKSQFRRLGVATRLLGSSPLDSLLDGVEVSHVSDDWFSFWRSKFEDPAFNPYRW